MNGIERNARIREFSAALDVIQEVYPRMELGQLKAYLHILLNPGIRAPELLDALGTVTRSGIYKTIRVLGEPTGPQEEGRKRSLGLIEENPDPTDGRAFQLMASWKGQELAERMAIAMKGKRDGTEGRKEVDG